MRRLACLTLLPVVAVCVQIARSADDTTTTTAPAAAAATQFTTKVQGTVPDLTGRWLAVGNVTIPNSTDNAPVAQGWDITTVDGKPHLVLRWGGQPQAMKESYDAAGSQKMVWQPTPEMLQAMRDGWDTLAQDYPPVATVETTISGPDDPSEIAKADANMKDALFVVTQTVTFAPGPNRPTKDVMVYGAKERAGDGYKGNFAIVTIAAAPFPIPISFNGSFQLYRLGDAPKPSLWQRILGMFAGCGRKAG